MKKSNFLRFLCFLLFVSCSPEIQKPPPEQSTNQLPVYNYIQGQTSGSVSVFPNEQTELPFLSQGTAAPGKIQTLKDLPADFWTSREIPKGGVRLFNGVMYWISRDKFSTASSHSAAKLLSYDGVKVEVLLDSTQWEWEFFLLSREEKNGVFLVYCCIGSSLGCYAGPSFFLDIPNRKALSINQGFDEGIYRNVDFGTGAQAMFQDELWFAYSKGAFLARVPTADGLFIIQDDGKQQTRLFPALTVGTTMEVIGDKIVINNRGQLVYWNGYLKSNPATEAVTEALWELAVQDLSTGAVVDRTIVPYSELLAREGSLGVEIGTFEKLRPPRFSTEWFPMMGRHLNTGSGDSPQAVLVLEKSGNTYRVQLPSGEIQFLPVEQVAF